MTFLPSPQQQKIFDFVNHGSGNASIVAVAGAGKTTTLINAIDLMQGQVLMCAFNKSIAEDINKKLESRGIQWQKATAKTMHGIGNSAWKKHAPEAKLNEYKCADIFNVLVGDNKRQQGWKEFALKLVSLAKQSGMGVVRVDVPASWEELIEHFNVADSLENDKDVHDATQVAKHVFYRSADLCQEQIDFDDMIFAPLRFNARFYQYDWLLVDEAQDTNAVRRELAKRCLKRNGRMLCVGDPRQAIYGFTGADGDAMDQLAKEFNCIELPLTVTYRCPKAVVRYAQNYVSHITAHDTAPEGSVTSVDAETFAGATLAGDTAVLCRFNAPLVQLAMDLIRRGVRCKIEGRDIGTGLVALARKWKTVHTVQQLDVRLSEYVKEQTAKHTGKNGGEQKLASLNDRVNTLRVFMEQGDREEPLQALTERITALFGDNVEGCVVLSTIHKSKGREWHHVYQLGRDPARFASKDWEQLQEQNLLYVAATRAQQTLTIVE